MTGLKRWWNQCFEMTCKNQLCLGEVTIVVFFFKLHCLELKKLVHSLGGWRGVAWIYNIFNLNTWTYFYFIFWLFYIFVGIQYLLAAKRGNKSLIMLSSLVDFYYYYYFFFSWFIYILPLAAASGVRVARLHCCCGFRRNREWDS